MSVDGTNVKDLEDTTKKMEAASLTKTTMLGLDCTQATTFHKTMPVDANHARRYCVKINSPWLMPICEEEMESIKGFKVSSIDFK